MALWAALLGTLTLGSIVGVESHWELLILLALVAGLAFVFDAITLHGMGQRAPHSSERKLK